MARGGANIRAIQAKSGTTIKLTEVTMDGSLIKGAVIRGTTMNDIDKARKLIQELITNDGILQMKRVNEESDIFATKKTK